MSANLSSADAAFPDRLLALLCCPNCRHERSLFVRAESRPAPMSTPLAPNHLWCLQCDGQFAITADGIPILFPTNSEHLPAFGDDSHAVAMSTDNLAANVSIYDAVSNDYEAFSRRSTAISRRMVAAATRVLAGRSGQPGELLHLDFGCGPGHVLGWLHDFKLLQVGLDVSLANLRNARRATGCLAVCADATNMPFVRQAFDLITESSVLHHIRDWRAVLNECRRVCAPRGGVVLDSEPSTEQMDWSLLARGVFAMRFPVYKALSYVRRDKYMFRSLKQARLNLLAEIHHQPGTGFPLDEIERMFTSDGFEIDLIRSPTPELASQARPTWKSFLLNALSGRNPWNAKYGPFTAVARSTERRATSSSLPWDSTQRREVPARRQAA